MNKYDYDILFINPPLEQVSDKTAQFGILTDYSSLPVKFFNPGILSMATFLDWKGHSVKIYDITSVSKIEEKTLQALSVGKPKVIAISGIYGLCYRSVIRIAGIVKKKFPDTYVVVGGHHMGLLGGVVLNECMDIDIVIRYEGEIPLLEFLEFVDGKRAISEIDGIVFRKNLVEKENLNSKDNIIPFTIKLFDSNTSCSDKKFDDILVNSNRSKVIDINEMPFIKFDLYPDYLTYQPFIEESRGCYGECEYCTNCAINGRKYRKKESKRFLEELEYVISIYGKDRVFPFLAAIFGVDTNNTTQICEGIIKRYGSLNWVAETRVDVQWEKYIDIMYESGCRQFEVGLESASTDILLSMKKTKDPNFYLEKTENLIAKVNSFKDASISVNYMFYAGETPETIRTGLNFLVSHMESIGNVDFFPLIAFPGTKLWNRFNEFNENHGTTIIKNKTWDTFHFYPINPSKYFSYEEAANFTRVVEKLFKQKG